MCVVRRVCKCDCSEGVYCVTSEEVCTVCLQ